MVLGSVGPLMKTLLTRLGYDLYRETIFERVLIRSPFEDWFSKDIGLFAEVYGANRETLSRIPCWLRPNDVPGSLWRYGVPEQWDSSMEGLGKTGLNEIESEPTYSDLIAFICRQTTDLRYLEIGVSVGKNFLAICDNVNGAAFVGLDVERLNPVLEEALGGNFKEHLTGVRQTVGSISGESRSVELSTYTSGKITYLRGDQFDPRTWAALRGKSFNFIFSDGVHSPAALRRELDFLFEEALIDTNDTFTMYWDDLVNLEMQSAFNECVTKLRSLFGRGRHGLHWTHGTYGNTRLNGLFTTIDL